MDKRDASHFITEYYTEGGKVELMIPTDATYDDFALLKDILAIVETKLKQRADRNSSEKPNNSTCSKMEQVEDDAYFLELMGAVERGEISDAGANQAWYECINHKDEPQTETQMKTQNSNLAFEKRTMCDCYNCKRYETEGECIECHYEPKDEPQTCSVNGRPYTDCCNCEHFKCTADEPQTNKEIVLDPSFAELSDEQFVEAMKLIEPQTDCPWK